MKYLALIIVPFLLVGCFFVSRSSTVKLNNQTIKVEVVSTQEGLTKGLAGVDHLDENQGMLFVFPQKNYYQFWMKDMLIPIDIIWINGRTVVDITSNVQPPADLTNQNNLPIFTSQEKVDYVLEIGAGLVEKYNIEKGQLVDININ